MDYVLSMFGADRPGLVAGLTRVLYEEEANLGDADMTRVGGTFAFILTFQLPENNIETARTRLDELAKQEGVTVSVSPSDRFQGDWGEVKPNTILSVYGADRPGIVYRVSRTLADSGINICDLDSSLDEEEDLYIMTLEVRRPDELSVSDLEEDLAEAGDELDVNITVRELSDTPL